MTRRVAVQGERGSFSHEAALRMLTRYGLAAEILFCAVSSEVFASVSGLQASAAVIPIENSLAGSVLEHYDLLLQHPLTIRAELSLRIRHHLIVAPGIALSQLRDVYSHPIALAQCRNFFMQNPALRAMPFYDTAGAAAHAVATGGATAGIASLHAAEQYNGEVLAAGIEDNPLNFTRFLLLTLNPGQPGSLDLDCSSSAPAARALDGSMASASPRASQTLAGEIATKVSLAFSVPNAAGSLVAALQIFARHGLNLTRLESRPVPGAPWQYVFYADYQLSSASQADAALRELTANCIFVKELGRYASDPTVTSELN